MSPSADSYKMNLPDPFFFCPLGPSPFQHFCHHAQKRLQAHVKLSCPSDPGSNPISSVFLRSLLSVAAAVGQVLTGAPDTALHASGTVCFPGLEKPE